MKFIDCNCIIGRRTKVCDFAPQDTLQIMRVLRSNEINAAAVSHALSYDYHPKEGNELLLEEIKGNKDFFIPVFVVMPFDTGEFFTPGILEKDIVTNKVKMLRLAPKELNYSLEVWSCKEIYEIAVKLNIPVILPCEDYEWSTLYDLLQSYPDLRIVLARAGFHLSRFFYPLMNQFKNLYMDLSYYNVHMGIEHLVQTFGSDRLLFGSGLPGYMPGSCKSMILNADISNEDKENIAHRNIERLMDGVVYGLDSSF